MVINSTTYDKYNMLINTKSRFLFYHFNDYLHRQARPTEKVRHTIITEVEYGLLKLQHENLQYFKEKNLDMSEKENLELGDGDETDLGNELMLDVIKSL